MSVTRIDRFVDEFAFLSNFHPSTIYIDGVRYATVEHAYQALKSLDPFVQKAIREAKTPGVAKRMGRACKLRPDWESVKLSVMRDLVRKKFQNPFLRDLLLATADAELIEGNHWNDTYYGVCRGIGQNWLGRILMEVREECRCDREEEDAIFGVPTHQHSEWEELRRSDVKISTKEMAKSSAESK